MQITKAPKSHVLVFEWFCVHWNFCRSHIRQKHCIIVSAFWLEQVVCSFFAWRDIRDLLKEALTSTCPTSRTQSTSFSLQKILAFLFGWGQNLRMLENCTMFCNKVRTPTLLEGSFSTWNVGAFVDPTPPLKILKDHWKTISEKKHVSKIWVQSQDSKEADVFFLTDCNWGLIFASKSTLNRRGWTRFHSHHRRNNPYP